MAITKSDKSITNLFGSIAAAQTMVEQFPFSFGINEKGFTCTFDLLAAIWNLISDEPLEQKIISWLSEALADTNCRWLQGIEETVKLAIELNISNLLTCDMSPLVPDRLIGGAEFLNGSDREIDFQGEGITIPVSALDFTGLLQHCPAEELNPDSVAHYFPCYNDNYLYCKINKKRIPEDVTPKEYPSIPSGEAEPYIKVGEEYYAWDRQKLSLNEIWKHDDFNAFLWYVKNKGVYGNIVERHKLIWDNRYKTKPFEKYVRKPEHFFTMSKGFDDNFDNSNKTEHIFPFSEEYIVSYNKKTPYKKKQILECRYIDADGLQPDSFQFRLPATNYYKTRKLTGKKKDTPIWRINKTIFEFNHDFLMSLKLFDAKTYLCQVIHSLLGQGNLSFNFSLTKDEEQIEALIEGITDQIINLSDIEVQDCYFNFSNEEYNQMYQNYSDKRKYGESKRNDINGVMDEIKTISDNGTPADEKLTSTIISNVLTEITRPSKTEDLNNSKWNFNYNLQFEIIRALVYPLVRPLFTPKIMTLFLINLNIMGDPLKLVGNIDNIKTIDFKTLLNYFSGIIVNIITQIKDMINEMLYSWVIEKITPILSIFSLRIIAEQIEAYKQLISEMITACAGFGGFLPTNKNGMIGTVDYVDIDPQKEEMKLTPLSKTNC